MGIFDTIHAFFKCPFCNANNEVRCQTKAFYSWFLRYEIGDLLKGGPYMNRDYGPSEQTWCECGSNFFCLWHVKNN